MLTLLDNKEVLRCDNYYVRELANGLDELIFTISVWDPVYPYLVEEAQIQDSGGQTYNIKQIDGGADMAKVICQLDLDAWNASLNLAYGNGISMERLAEPRIWQRDHDGIQHGQYEEAVGLDGN